MKSTQQARRVSGATGRSDGAASSPGCEIAASMLAEFERECATTRTFLERLPENRLTWRPHEKSMTAGQLALHIAQVPHGVLSMTLANEASPPDFSRGREQPSTLREIKNTLERSARYVRETLPTIDDGRMLATFSIVKDGRWLMSMPRAEFLRSILLNHWYHHRGQLGVYLRLLGSDVPSSYGPSGDEPPFASVP